MQTKLKRLAGVLALAMGGLVAGNASAAVLVDTTGLARNTLWGSTSVNLNDWAATRFSTGSHCGLGCELSTVTLRLTNNQAGGGVGTAPTNFSNFELGLYADNGNSVGGALTTTGNIFNPSGDTLNPSSGVVTYTNGSNGLLYEFAPATQILLDDNTTYWLRLTGNKSGSPLVAWDAITDTGGSLQFLLGGSGPPTGINGVGYAMKVEATALSAVPVPAAVWLMGSALIGFVGWGGRVKV